MFAVLKQHDVSRSSRAWAEWSGEYPVIHRHKATAEAALIKIADAPEGKEPGIYAGLTVEQVNESVYARVVD